MKAALSYLFLMFQESNCGYVETEMFPSILHNIYKPDIIIGYWVFTHLWKNENGDKKHGYKYDYVWQEIYKYYKYSVILVVLQYEHPVWSEIANSS